MVTEAEVVVMEEAATAGADMEEAATAEDMQVAADIMAAADIRVDFTRAVDSAAGMPADFMEAELIRAEVSPTLPEGPATFHHTRAISLVRLSTRVAISRSAILGRHRDRG